MFPVDCEFFSKAILPNPFFQIFIKLGLFVYINKSSKITKVQLLTPTVLQFLSYELLKIGPNNPIYLLQPPSWIFKTQRKCNV